MNKALAAAAAIIASIAAPASAHRLDEYLQATIISVEKDRIHASMRLVPGVAVSSIVIAGIDANRDGVISERERRAYAERVLRDLSLSVDGESLRPRLVSVKFPEIEAMKEGLGEIQIELSADLRSGGDSSRRLIFENHHQNRIAAYLVNCLVPRDKNIRITAQNRKKDQSFYQLDYAQAWDHSDPPFLQWFGARGWLVTVALLFSARLVLLWRQRAVRNLGSLS